MDTKTRPIYMQLTRDSFQMKNAHKVRTWKKAFHANAYVKKAKAAKLISDKTNF